MYVAGRSGWLCHFAAQGCRERAFSNAHTYRHSNSRNDSIPDTDTYSHGCDCLQEFDPAISFRGIGGFSADEWFQD